MKSSTSAQSRLLVAIVFLVFFVISFLTNIIGPLVPDVIASFHLSLTLAAVLPFCFFIAYGVLSIPSGFLVERWGEKLTMVSAFLLGTCGAVSFALFPTYHMATVSLFVMGAAMAALQVAINPLLRVAGGPENFAFNSAAAQLVFGGASFVSPLVYSHLVTGLGAGTTARGPLIGLLSRITPPALPWASIYWLFAAGTALMAVFIWRLKMPVVERQEDETAGTLGMYRELLPNPMVWLYFLSIFAYVGCEQGTADWMSEFLARYHGVDPHTAGASAVAYFWGLLTAGCFVGMVLLKYYDSRRVLIGFSLGALVALTTALFAPGPASRIAFPVVGLFASIMWPTIVSLALNSVPRHHGPLAGILCTGIMGGAVVPLLIGRLGDQFGLRVGMLVLYVTFGFILSIGFWARPLVTNKLASAK